MHFTKIFTTAFLTMAAVVTHVAAVTPVDNHKKNDRSSQSLRSNKDKCGKLDKCDLLNIDTGKKVSLSDHGAVAIDSPTSRHTVVCDTKGNIEDVTFEYNGQTHIESVKPWSMAGDTKDITHTVPYLTTPGKKEIKVTGKFDNSICFEETYSYAVYSDMSDVPDQHRDLAVRATIILDFGDVIIIIVVEVQ